MLNFYNVLRPSNLRGILKRFLRLWSRPKLQNVRCNVRHFKKIVMYTRHV